MGRFGLGGRSGVFMDEREGDGRMIEEGEK